MIGITSYGAYTPRLRLNRMSIAEAMGWFAPAIVMVAQGERSFCNWDEDSLTMAVAAARDCLSDVDKGSLDALYLCSTTLPFSDRLNAGVVKTALNLKDQVVAADLTSSLRAGTIGLGEALSAVKAGACTQALVAATDKRQAKTAYFYEMWFGDGAAAFTVGSEDVIAEYLGSHTVTHDFVDHYRGENQTFDYMWEERWVRDMGYSRIIPEAVEGLLESLHMTMDDVDKLVFPCFFKKEHQKIAKNLGAAPEKVLDNMHEVCGETGAAHPLLMFARALEEASPGDRILVAGFGQGCDAFLFRVTENIEKLPRRTRVKETLEKGETTSNYARFLKFRELLDTEMGIRAEAPTQTAMTVMWRRRDMLLGMVGGLCSKCKTPQFPRAEICINPDCRATGTQEPCEFSDRPAVVKSFTGDLLAVSVDPPAIYGMVEFVGGGRFMADFTDCTMDDVAVGGSVSLSFRRRYVDKERGFSGYFWKAVPAPKEAVGKTVGEEIRFDGRVAIVTGAGAGLGRAYSLELARRGAKVLVNDLGGAPDGTGKSSSAANLVVREIVDAGGEAIANYDSVAIPEGGENIVNQAVEAWGRVDILINNAGILRDKTLAKMEPGLWDAVMDVHLKGAYNVTRPAFLKMREQRYGRVILTTSAAGLYGNFGQTNYSAAKLGLVGFMNTLKIEGERAGINVNTVAPIAGTRMTEEVLPPDLFEKLKPEFVAPFVLYLASEMCEETGMIFNAGGGYFNRVAVVTGRGTVLGDGNAPPALEDIHKHWEDLDDIAKGDEYTDATKALTPMLEAFDPEKAEEVEEGTGSGPGLAVKGIFDKMPHAFQPKAAEGVDLVFQFKISGEGGGEWYAEIRKGECGVEQDVHESPTTTIKMEAADFLALMKGKLNPMTAYTSGKLKIEGDIIKSQLIGKLFKF